MARIRSIKPEFWSDQELTQLPRDVRMLYVALWNFADEHGRLPGDPRLIKSWCFPLDDDVSAAIVDGWLDQLAGIRKVHRYTVGGGRFLYLPNLGDHQRLEPGKKDSRHPAPEDGDPEHQVTGDSTARAEKSAQNPDESALARARYGTGDRGQGTGDMSSSETAAPTSDTGTDLEPTRGDVERVCIHLADRIEGNGAKRPTVTKRWRKTARLMLERDERTEDQIHRAIDWCQDDEFWRANILSMPKLREKYDQLRLRAQARHPPNGQQRSTTDERVSAGLELAARLETQENQR